MIKGMFITDKELVKIQTKIKDIQKQLFSVNCMKKEDNIKLSRMYDNIIKISEILDLRI